MSFDELQQSIADDNVPPPGCSVAIQALWHDARGDWDAAHAATQQDEQHPDSAWVHAYLHRKEGDLGNAGYWYARAGRPVPARGVTLESEWIAIARELVGR